MLVARCGTYDVAVAEAKIFGDNFPKNIYHVHYVDERVPGTMMWGFWAVDDVTDGVFEIRKESAVKKREEQFDDGTDALVHLFHNFSGEEVIE